MSSINISMKLFGAFRKYGESVDVTIQGGSPVSVVKEELCTVLGHEAAGLIEDSVISNDETILPRDYIIEQDASLSILPPVCGG
jgi:molybdopterin converting factor small subunit